MGAKEKRAKLQIIIATLLFVVITFGELYVMINYSDSYAIIIGLVIVALIAVYVILDGIMLISSEREKRKQEQYDTIFKSEKAGYLLQKKHFEDIEEQLILLEEKSKIPAEELINAQKGIAKVIINRSKENADAIINSNDQVLERLDEIEEVQNNGVNNILDQQKHSGVDSKGHMDAKLQDIVLHMKDMELRLNQTLGQAPRMAVPQMSAVEELSVMEETPILEEVSVAVEVPEVEELPEIMETEILADEVEIEQETVIEETSVAEELPPMPDLSDPNKAMSPDEIAALFANMSSNEPVVEEEPVKEELPPMPDLSDPNKAMSPDEIAALFANMSGGDSAEDTEEVVVEEEELPPMPDLSDPNKPMSPDEIAALIANL